MTRIQNNEVKNVAGCNLIYDITNFPKRAKSKNSHYSPILHECINTIKGKANIKTLLILLESVCSSTIVMWRLVEYPMQWHTQAGNITTNIKVNVQSPYPYLAG